MPNFEKFTNLELSRFAGNRLSEALFLFPCPQRVLMVTDGSLSFTGAAFGLSEFVSIVQAAGHTVSTAHRSGGNGASIATAFNFASAAKPVTLANYDQIWLFGYSTVPLSAAEQGVIANFMKAGGGVFATGDHANLGQGMGANIPRVRSMRDWASVPMSSPSRLDTVLDAGIDNIKQFNDQANAVPQRTFPVFFSNGDDDFVASSWAVHPVLRHASGAVDCMPDHPHESECFAPTPVAGTFAGVEEWPAPPAAPAGSARVAPQVISVSISAGRFVVSGAPTSTGTKPPVKPRSFGGISAYDGDAAKVGRIVCDSTWHHFVNINLNGAGAGVDTLGNAFTGLYAGGVATPEYKKIQSYYLSTVRWLAPATRRSCWPFIKVALARFDFEMMEVALPQPHPCPWDPLLEIGRTAEQAINRHWGPGAAADVVADMLAGVQLNPALTQMLRAQQGSLGDEGRKAKDPTLLPLRLVRQVLLGSVVNLIANKLPSDEEGLAKFMRVDHDTVALELMREGIASALPALSDYLKRAVKNTEAQATAITALR
jgi:hypothetical protein